MGNTVRGMRQDLMECGVRKEAGGGVCDLNNSLFGEDAFYREAYQDCDEGNKAHDHLFRAVSEQARLKWRKGSVLTKYASHSFKKSVSNASWDLRQCIATPKALGDGANKLGGRKVRSNSNGSSSNNGSRHSLSYVPSRGSNVGQFDQSWLGSTMAEWIGKELPPTGEGPYWSKGGGVGLRVRSGPNYALTGIKAESTGTLYETLCCDAVRADTKIENIIGRLVKDLPSLPESYGESDRGGGGSLQWTAECQAPRIICINMMLPYETGINPFSKDAGCSFVGFFHIKPETIQALRSEHPSPAVRLLRDFCAGPAARPGGLSNDPDRSLGQRAVNGVKKDQQAGLFKAVAKCVNPADVNVPDMFHTYNGKPCLITKSGYIVRDPAGEWLEVGIDIRGFNMLARKMLCSFRPILTQTKIHYGFMIQGVEDHELPEALICDMLVHGINMIDDPVHIDGDPRS